MSRIDYHLNDEQWHRIYQAAFGAYVDEALNGLNDPPHVRVFRASQAAAEAVVSELGQIGAIRTPLTPDQVMLLARSARRFPNISARIDSAGQDSVT